MKVEFSFAKGKRFALPILFRLYRKRKKKLPPGRPKGERKQCGEATGREYRTRPELAADMLEIVAEWLPRRDIRVVGDSEYSGKSVSRRLPENVELVGRMPMNAALYAELDRRHFATARQARAAGRASVRTGDSSSRGNLASLASWRWVAVCRCGTIE